MKIERWLSENTESLVGKKIAVTGTTGGLGQELCKYLARLGASLILLDRSKERSHAFRDELCERYGVEVECLTLDLVSLGSVKETTETLIQREIDIFIHNAGAYSIPRYKSESGYDNVFQINFASPYYIIHELLPTLSLRGGRVIVVGSIAHGYSKSCPCDIDFSTRKRASLVYGNAKRYLMFSLFELFKNEERASLSVTHPGISFTNITAHYPKLIFAIIKHPMKLIFMKPRVAALSILRGVFQKCDYKEWIGPAVFDVWGLPKKKRLHTVDSQESGRIAKAAEEVYLKIKNL